MPIKLIDRFGGLGDAIDEARRRMGIAPGDNVQLYELPKLPSSLLGTLGSLLGVDAADTLSVTDLPAIKDLLRGVPASVLVTPGVAYTRLPFDIIWE